MSDAQIRKLFSAIAALGGDVQGLQKSVDKLTDEVEALKEEDKAHWSAIDTGRHDQKAVAKLVAQHDKALTEAKKKGRNRALAVTALPAIAGVVEFILRVLEHWQ